MGSEMCIRDRFLPLSIKKSKLNKFLLHIKNYICKVYNIHVENIRTRSYHGCLKEESIVGGDYRTDVWIKLKDNYRILNDELSETVDYGAVTDVVVEEMKKKSKLIESVCERIVNRLIKMSDSVEQISVKVFKINPPIDGDVENVSVMIKKER